MHTRPWIWLSAFIQYFIKSVNSSVEAFQGRNKYIPRFRALANAAFPRYLDLGGMVKSKGSGKGMLIVLSERLDMVNSNGSRSNQLQSEVRNPMGSIAS